MLKAMSRDRTFPMIMRETSLAPSQFAASFAKDVASRIADLPLADVCEQGGTAVDASVNVSDIEHESQRVRANIEVIFNERFPLGCGSTLTDRVRRARFKIQLDRATRICTFTRIDNADETDL
jgi:hypothetical protein